MKLPRDLSGVELARLLKRFGYEIVRQTGSHLRLLSTFRGSAHHITIPAHHDLKLGTLAAILSEVAEYLEMNRTELQQRLFED